MSQAPPVRYLFPTVLRRLPQAHALPFFLIYSGCQRDNSDRWELPAIAASSKHIDYGAWADTTDICMGNKFEEWEGFISQTAPLLKIDPTDLKIFYSWVPFAARSEDNWPCADIYSACTRTDIPGYSAVIFASSPIGGLHEIVHAMTDPTLGKAHPVFQEGEADYFSAADSTEYVLSSFSETFPSIVEKATRPETYRVSMHFVGTLLERGDLAKYKSLRARVPRDGNFSDFSIAFEDIYNDNFTSALEEMNSATVYGQGTLWGCDKGETLEWNSSTTLTQELQGACGDASFAVGGLSPPEATGFKYYGLNIPQHGIYSISISGAEGSFIELDNCPDVEASSLVLANGQSTTVVLYQGQHQIRVSYPPDPALPREVTLSISLDFAGPP